MELGLISFLFLFCLAYVNPIFGFYKLKNSLVFPIVFLGFIVLIIIFSSQTLKSAQYGFYLWINIIFPSLFPFFVGAELLQGTGLIKAAGILLEPIMRPLFNVPGVGSFAFAMGIFSGYPGGAKITADLRKLNLCTKTEGERLLAFTNNSSPMFITGAVGAGILGHPELGLLLLVSHLLACITVGILFRFYGLSTEKTKVYRVFKRKEDISYSIFYKISKELENSPQIGFNNIGLKLGEAIKNSIDTLLMIGGFVVLFCVIINLLINLKVIKLIAYFIKYIFLWLGFNYDLATSLVSGFFEITTGTSYLSLSFAPLEQKLIIAASIIGWGGLSVHSQVASIISKTDINLKPYLIGKFMQGIFAGIYTGLYLFFYKKSKNQELSAFCQLPTIIQYDWMTYFTNSLKLTIILIIITASLTIAAQIRKYVLSSN